MRGGACLDTWWSELPFHWTPQTWSRQDTWILGGTTESRSVKDASIHPSLWGNNNEHLGLYVHLASLTPMLASDIITEHIKCVSDLNCDLKSRSPDNKLLTHHLCVSVFLLLYHHELRLPESATGASLRILLWLRPQNPSLTLPYKQRVGVPSGHNACIKPGLRNSLNLDNEYCWSLIMWGIVSFPNNSVNK